MHWSAGRVAKYALASAGACGALGAAVSLRANNYEANSVGVVRLGRAAWAVFGIGYTYKSVLHAPGWDKSSPEYRQAKAKCHQAAADKLLELCCTNKGVYIKVGQHIAALDYLVPNEYVQTMRVLHSNAPTNSIEEVYRVIREDLNVDPKQHFKEFDPEPLGVASLAQVHRAVLQTGEEVAIKVQHPYVLGNAIVDVKTMEVLFGIMSWVFPELKLRWLVEETKKNIFKELDFRQEGANTEKMSEMFRAYEWLRVPEIHWNLTTRRVLTMQFLAGGQVNDLAYIRKNGIDPVDISSKLGILYSRMIFEKGYVHSDPHPGNILVRKSPRGDCDIVLLDHGLYAELTPTFRVEYAKLWLSILNADRKGMRRQASILGIKGDLYGIFACIVSGRSWDSIMRGIDKTKPSAAEKELFQKEFGSIFTLINEILESVDRQMILIFKTNDLIRGIEHTLQTSSRMQAFKVMSFECINSVYQGKINEATTAKDKISIRLGKYWLLLKLSIYYLWMGVVSKAQQIFYPNSQMVVYEE